MKKFVLPFLFFISICSYSQNSPLTVIGNNNGVPEQLSMVALKSVMNGNQAKWSNGQKVVIALMKLTTDAGKSICSKIYGKTAAEITKHWLMVSMKGAIDAPVFFNTAADLQNFVVKTSGAIGVFSGSVTTSSAKTVLIDGKNTF